MKKSCQGHCFSTLNHNLAYCYDDSRVIKFVWMQIVRNRLKTERAALMNDSAVDW